jgi:hypothetical protein
MKSFKKKTTLSKNKKDKEALLTMKSNSFSNKNNAKQHVHVVGNHPDKKRYMCFNIGKSRNPLRKINYNLFKEFEQNYDDHTSASTTCSNVTGGDPCWKSAVDHVTKQTYFYNRDTREVTWLQPDSFLEWKVYSDRATQRCYYHNVLTKETTWQRPRDIKIDVSHILDGNYSTNGEHIMNLQKEQMSENRDRYLPTYLTKWSKLERKLHHADTLDELVDKNPYDEIARNHQITASTICKNKGWNAFYDCSSGTHFFYNFATKESSLTKPKAFQEWVSVRAKSSNGFYFYNLLTGESSWTIQEANVPKMDKDVDLKMNILSDSHRHYYQGDKLNHLKVTQKLQGREAGSFKPFISVLDKGDINPFDEKATAYVKTNRSLSSLTPYDERIDRFKNTHLPLMVSDSRSYQSPEMLHCRYLTKPIQFEVPSGRTIQYLPR